MVQDQDRSRRKPSGGKYKDTRTKRLRRMGRNPVSTKIDEKRVRTERTKGAKRKNKLLSVNVVNVLDPATKKFSKEKFSNSSSNPANRHYARRSIITKGSIIDTPKGKARVTSRPGQTGTLNAVLE